MNIVAGGFDAGIHFGEYIEKDMIAARVWAPTRDSGGGRENGLELPAGAPQPLLASGIRTPGARFDVTADGRRFLIPALVTEASHRACESDFKLDDAD